LTRIQDYLHIGKIRADKNKPYSVYVVSTKETMMYILNNINGLIRLKEPGFKKSCSLFNLDFIEANYNIGLYDSYLAGLVDTDGSIVFNYAGNRIECNLEFLFNEYSSKLNFDHTILNCKPSISIRKRSSSSGGKKDLSSIAFKFQNVNSMLFVYDYFMHNRLYCDFNVFLNSKNNNTTISSFELMDTQSAGNQEVSGFTFVGSSETECRLPVGKKSPFKLLNEIRCYLFIYIMDNILKT
jgi:hypothetical protein